MAMSGNLSPMTIKLKNYGTTMCIPADVLTPAMRVRTRLRLLGWSIETLGAARAAREGRTMPYTEGTVRGWLRRMDEGRARRSTLDAIAKTIGVNSGSFFASDNPKHLLTSPTKGYTPVKLKHVPAGMFWPKAKKAADRSRTDVLTERLRVALMVRGMSLRDAMKALGISRARFWRVWRLVKRYFNIGRRKSDGSRLENAAMQLIEKLCELCNICPERIRNRADVNVWSMILDPRREDYSPYHVTDIDYIELDEDIPPPPVVLSPLKQFLAIVEERMAVLELTWAKLGRIMDAVQYSRYTRNGMNDFLEETWAKWENPLFRVQLASALMLDGPQDFANTPEAAERRAEKPSRGMYEIFEDQMSIYDDVFTSNRRMFRGTATPTRFPHEQRLQRGTLEEGVLGFLSVPWQQWAVGGVAHEKRTFATELEEFHFKKVNEGQVEYTLGSLFPALCPDKVVRLWPITTIDDPFVRFRPPPD